MDLVATLPDINESLPNAPVLYSNDNAAYIFKGV